MEDKLLIVIAAGFLFAVLAFSEFVKAAKYSDLDPNDSSGFVKKGVVYLLAFIPVLITYFIVK